MVYSLSRVSTNNGRTFKSSIFWPVAFGHFAEIHLPKVMTCGFGTAEHSPQATLSVIIVKETFRRAMTIIMLKTGTTTRSPQ